MFGGLLVLWGLLVDGFLRNAELLLVYTFGELVVLLLQLLQQVLVDVGQFADASVSIGGIMTKRYFYFYSYEGCYVVTIRESCSYCCYYCSGVACSDALHPNPLSSPMILKLAA